MAEATMGRLPGATASSPWRGKRLQLLLVAAVLLSAIGYLVYSGLRTNVYYQTVAELRAQGNGAAGRQVRVAGIVAADSIVRQDAGSAVRFTLADAGGTLPVVYKGAIPDIFQPGIEVVVEGKYRAGGDFEATTLLAKCPSKFDQTAAK